MNDKDAARIGELLGRMTAGTYSSREPFELSRLVMALNEELGTLRDQLMIARRDLEEAQAGRRMAEQLAGRTAQARSSVF